ncbi:MAG TPA: hypothetical protein VIU12_34305 [Chryseolinea sp.]
MTKHKFKDNLDGAVEPLMGLAKKCCSNSFSSNYRFTVKPNVDTLDNHLDQGEIAFHYKLLKYRDKYLTAPEVIDLLWTENKVPLWINTSVLESSTQWTTIELMTSRRLRPEEELNKVVDQFPPFHIVLPLPPGAPADEKFDINWRAVKTKNGGLLTFLKRLVAGR